MQEIEIRGGRDHPKIDAEGLDRTVGVVQLHRDRVRRGVGARPPKAVDRDGCQPPQFDGELLDVYTSAPVDIRWPFAGEESDAHWASIGSTSR